MAEDIVERIRLAGISIYDPLDDTPDLYLDNETLERVLNTELVGLNLDYQLRTRSKILKVAVCLALGYPAPKSFKKTQPRFPGQNFDTYIQKADNLQIWNEKVEVSRRYVLVRLDGKKRVERVRVVTGEVIQRLDTTGTLTHKYQAKARAPVVTSRLVSGSDTKNVTTRILTAKRPIWPAFLPIAQVFSRLSGLLGTVLDDPGLDQERSRGGKLHSVVCQQLGMKSWNDDGQFPDVTEQLLEIKLQTASTIDLGLVCPDSEEHIADYPQFQHRDVRYAVFYGKIDSTGVRLNHLVLCVGSEFFTYFKRFEGNVQNKKLQIPLPRDFFT